MNPNKIEYRHNAIILFAKFYKYFINIYQTGKLTYKRHVIKYSEVVSKYFLHKDKTLPISGPCCSLFPINTGKVMEPRHSG